MRKIFPAIVIIVILIISSNTGIAATSVDNDLDALYAWGAKGFGAYEMIASKNSGVLNSQVFILGNFIEECALRLKLSGSIKPSDFSFPTEDRAEYQVSMIDSDILPVLFNNDQPSIVLSSKISLVSSYIEEQILQGERLTLLYGDKYTDSDWFVKMVVILRKAQITLDYALYLPDRYDVYKKAWME